MDIRWRKEDKKVKKQTDIDRHGPKPSSNSSQPPNPPPFSLPTTFKTQTAEAPDIGWESVVVTI